MHCKECGYPFAKGEEVCSQCGTPRERLDIDWNLSNYPEPGKVEDLEFDWNTGEFTEHKEGEEPGEAKEARLPETEIPQSQIPEVKDTDSGQSAVSLMPEISKIPEQQINPADLGIPFITREEREAQEGGFSLDFDVEVEPKEAPVPPKTPESPVIVAASEIPVEVATPLAPEIPVEPVKPAVASAIPSIPEIPVVEAATPLVPEIPEEPVKPVAAPAIPSIPEVPPRAEITDESVGSLDSLDKFFEYDKASNEFQRLLEAQQNRVEEFDAVVKPQIEPAPAIPFIDSFKIEEEEIEKEEEPEVIWLGKMEQLKATEVPVIEIKPEIEPEEVVVPEIEAEFVTELESVLEVEPTVEPEIEIEPEEVPIIEIETREEAVVEPEPELEIEAETQPEPEPEMETEIQGEPGIEIEPEVEPELVPEAEPELVTETDPAAETELVTEPAAEAEPAEELPLVWMEASEDPEEEKPEKAGVGETVLGFITIVLILIGLFFGAIIGIQHYKPETEAAAKAWQIQESVVSVLVQAKDKIASWLPSKEETDDGDETGEADEDGTNGHEDQTDDPEGDGEGLDDTEGTLMEKLINSTSDLNENIKLVAANDELVWEQGKNYGKASIADSQPVESEEDQEKVVAGLIEFNSKWIDYINSKNKDVIGLTKAGSQARKNVETFSKVGKVKQEFLRMEIGEIRSNGKEYYAWIYEEISEEKDGKTQKNIYNYVYSLEKINNKMLITNYYKY